jgi:hypothetical protein
MSWWLGFLTVHIRIYPLQDLLPTESRSTYQPSVPEIILPERHYLLQLSEMFSVAAVEAQRIDVQFACSVRLLTKETTDPLGNRWIGLITIPDKKTSKREGFTVQLPFWAGSSE